MSKIKSRPYFSFKWAMRNLKFEKKLMTFYSMDMLTYYGHIEEPK